MVMSQPSFRETEKWKKGHNGEHIVAALLRRDGWYVIPSYDYSGDDNNKAPRIQGANSCHVLPDLDIAKGGDRRWAEVKTKEQATFTRKTQRFEHGIPLRHYNDYLEVQHITGNEVWLFVYEEKSSEILCAKLDDLSQQKREYNGGKMSRGGMIFFPRDAFRVWKKL